MVVDSRVARAYQQQYRHDVKRIADRDRLIRQAGGGWRGQNRLYCQALNWMGHWLVARGQDLQERYDTSLVVPTAHSVRRTY
jgi:hypothetical protein